MTAVETTTHDTNMNASALAFADASLSTSTRRAYASDLRSFDSYCAQVGATSMPATANTVAAWAAQKATTGAKASTITRAMAAIATAHKQAGHASPTSSAKVTAVLSGIRRTLGTAPKKKSAMVVEDLRRAVATCGDDVAGVRDAAMLVVGFAGAFRRSEIAGLTVDDVAFETCGVVVLLRRSKTDQQGEGRTVGLPYGSDPTTCPVRTLQRWLAVSGVVEGPLFRSLTRHGHVGAAMSGEAIGDVVRARANSAGLTGDYSGHSLRAGFVTTAAKANKSLSTIMAQTGHTSTATVLGYIRRASLFSDHGASGIGL